MSNYYLAVDIGASSGRHIIAWMENGKLLTEEVHRFYNGLNKVNGHLCWDVEHLYKEIKEGLKKCKEINKIPVMMGIDTWAVDFVLLDENDKILGNTVGYRDDRTKGMDDEVYKIISEPDLYKRAGIQKQIFNTIYQLMAVKKQEPENMAAAKSMLFIPDYLNFLLTGVKKCEYTNATTSQLVDATTKDWDYELIDMLGYNKDMFLPISVPGTTVGNFSDAVAAEVGFNCEVVLPATHDTGSAVLAVPSTENDTLYISSGTWSLMGVEIMKANASDAAHASNFTNEGGYDYRFRFLKNIMGLWMIQNLKKELDDKYSFAELCDMAETSSCDSIVDCQDSVFLAPESMMVAVADFCKNSNQAVPVEPADYARVIYRSLAQCYGRTIKEIEGVTGTKYKQLNIVGGGANAVYLNKLTAKACGIPVMAGPTEATAIGNLVVQLIKSGECKDLTSARKCIFDSFDVKVYE